MRENAPVLPGHADAGAIEHQKDKRHEPPGTTCDGKLDRAHHLASDRLADAFEDQNLEEHRAHKHDGHDKVQGDKREMLHSNSDSNPRDAAVAGESTPVRTSSDRVDSSRKHDPYSSACSRAEIGAPYLLDRTSRRGEISFRKHNVGQSITIERTYESIQSLVQNLGQLAACRDNALASPGETLNEGKIRLGRTYDSSEVDGLRRFCEGEPASTAADPFQVARSRQDVDHLHQMSARHLVNFRRFFNGNKTIARGGRIH